MNKALMRAHPMLSNSRGIILDRDFTSNQSCIRALAFCFSFNRGTTFSNNEEKRFTILLPEVTRLLLHSKPVVRGTCMLDNRHLHEL